MCPPLTNDVWIYGRDDDTLFRLITLGTDGLQLDAFQRLFARRDDRPVYLAE